MSLALLAAPLVHAGRAEEPPKVKVSNIRRAFHNGEHNAFTDLVRFGDKLYLTFRSCPDGHMVHPTSSILVLASDDNGKSWEQVHRFGVPKRDTRDPHFLVFNDRLFVYTGTWYSGDTTLPRDQYDLNLHLGYAVHSDDGRHWSDPVLLEGTFGHYIWRAAAFDGKAYLCGRRKQNFEVGPRGEGQTVQSAMLESDDGLVWRKRALFQENRGDETAFLFEPDGSIVAVGRSGSEPAQLLRSQPPYTDWDRKDLFGYVGGPLLARWGDRYLVGGRKSTGQGPKTTLYWLADAELVECAQLPSGGDNSYPGFVAFDASHGLLSWYSSHEKDADGNTITAIYLADLEIEE
ncbi:MAG: exo-alpha-sialidase [Planctomycetota bacterium]|nr:MAG: exo-alpha-sialidase [Planctomycetota bacterium]